MNIFVSEYTCGGGWPEPDLTGSLAVEGRAMLTAIVEDFSRIAGVTVTTTWDVRLGEPPFRLARATIVESPADELRAFRRFARECDGTFVIAPEFDDILLERCRIVEESGGKLLGPDSRAVELCADKLGLAELLSKAGVPTIPTDAVAWKRSPPREQARCSPRFPCVIKPRDGAGSQDMYLVRGPDEYERVRRGIPVDAQGAKFICQPYVAGRSVSVALLVPKLRLGTPAPKLRVDGHDSVWSLEGAASADEAELREMRSQAEPGNEVFPVAKQILSDDGRFRYLGGRIPTPDVDHESVQRAARAACRCVPGLSGYVGVDLIVPDDSQNEPLVVEINPRLTTSYLGYRALAEDNLAERMLSAMPSRRPIQWRTDTFEFNAGGSVVRVIRIDRTEKLMTEK